MQKVVQIKTKGMQRDLSASAFNSEYAYENKNMRIMPTNESTLLSLINEKGNLLATIKGLTNGIEGIPIGQIVVNDILVLFTCDSNPKVSTVNEDDLEAQPTVDTYNDKIYKIWFKDGVLTGKELYSGNLNFSYQHPIEALSFYENEELIKVYWTDGINQPRMINIAADITVVESYNNNSFDFVKKIEFNEEVTIKKNEVSNGIFASGVIQYAFTYFNKYGQESNIFYVSPLYYLSYSNRSGSPEDKVNNSFDIEITNADTNFDYIRVYSIQRTSINATPNVKRVVDLATSEYTTKIIYTDNGLSGDSIDPTNLLYVGGEEVIFGTMTQKDNTLFLGDIQLKNRKISNALKVYLKGKDIVFTTELRSIKSPKATGYYPYYNQLKQPSNEIKTFKYLEHYRFGIQFQHKTGKWSGPIHIKDVVNDQHIESTFYESDSIKIPTAKFILDDTTIINYLHNNDYVRIRPVVVYPNINDRECICQGILCPTVYNVADRFNNTPFAQSSWFTRPNAPFDESKSFHDVLSAGRWYADWKRMDLPSGIPSEPSIYSKAAVMSNNSTIVKYDNKDYTIDLSSKGAWAEFRHNRPIPGNDNRNAEIQCIWNPQEDPYVSKELSDSDLSSWVSNNAENYYIDQSILTLHSPDIEFDDNIKNLDTSNLKLRIVGIVPLSAFVSDIDIQTSTPVNNFHNSTELPIGFYKEPIGVENDFSYDVTTIHLGNSHFGWRGLISGAFWFDEITGYRKGTSNPDNLTTGFVVYPWHRNGSLNNTKFATDGYKSAVLDKKKMSNLRYSYKTYYLDDNYIWNAYIKNNSTRTGISGVSIFDSNEVSLIKIPAQENSGLPDINYYGNVDKLLISSRVGTKKDGYPIMTTGTQNAATDAHKLFISEYTQVNSKFTEQTTGVDPVRIKYKSTPHAVLALNYTTAGNPRILPTIKDGKNSTQWDVNLRSINISNSCSFWDKNRKPININQDSIKLAIGPIHNVPSIQHGWLWLGELYNDNVQNRFGGDTDEALENNQWLPCGEPVDIIDKETNSPKTSIEIKFTEGDTYYQRYDHIKTYPFTLEDQNSVTDIVSFMCETRVNLDGRYDRNRGQTSNFHITPSNFNLVNEVYSQTNNFFTYRVSNPNKINLDDFHNTITWTKTKTSGEFIDSWTNITLASTLDLDGDKGYIRALRRINNNIIAFQDKGISQILYNENMQISSTEGVPIEIANSGKVNGKRYLSDKVGCTNKWSICESPNGLYFIDDITKGIYLFNGQLNNLSDKFGFHSWINSNSTLGIWNPVDFDNFVTHYDKINGDVFFTNKNECLAFSESLGQFSSFYSYENTPYFVNIGDRGLAIKKSDTTYKVWLHNEGDYNMYFGKYQPFYTTIIANPDMPMDKIFNTVEFRADSWNNEELLNTTFDTLTTWNEYQKGSIKLVNKEGKPSNLKRKFRIWRANIPRDNVSNRYRMRSPWLYIKLGMYTQNTNKTILHDMIIHYTE